MRQDDLMGLVAFYRRGSTYDVIQAQTPEGWSFPWTFTPCSIHAAEKVAWMMRHTGITRIRHARRAWLRWNEGQLIEAIVVTVLPSREQTVISIKDGNVFPVSRYLRDECLDALDVALAIPALK